VPICCFLHCYGFTNLYLFVLQFWQLLEKHVGISMSCQDTGGSIEYC